MSNKKRIAFFGIKYYPSRGGSSRVAEGIARVLQNEYDITIYCYRDKRAASHLNHIDVFQIPKIPFGTIGVFLYYFVCCLHLLFSKKYDIIHVHKTDSAIFIPLLRLKSKVIATSQEAPYVRDKWNAIGKSYFRLMEQFFIKSGALLTSVSRPLAEYYEKTYGKKVHFIPNCIDKITVRDFDATKQLLGEEIYSSPYFFFAARRIMSTKGCHTMLEAFSLLDNKPRIVIAGEESHTITYMTKVKTLAKNLPVKFLGYIDSRSNLMSLIEKAAYFIFPSETEGLSLMLLEAASTGTPIICSDIPENTQVFNDEEVLFFKNKDHHDLAQKIKWAMENPETMHIKALKAQAKALNEYSSEAIAGLYNEQYQKLLFSNPEKTKAFAKKESLV